jgi:hypothetical protein
MARRRTLEESTRENEIYADVCAQRVEAAKKRSRAVNLVRAALFSGKFEGGLN